MNFRDREKELAIIAEFTPELYEQDTVDEIYRKAGEIVEKMGYKYVIFHDDGTHLCLKYASLSDSIVEVGKKLTGLDAMKFRMPHAEFSVYNRHREEKKPIFFEDANESTQEVLRIVYGENPGLGGFVAKGIVSVADIVIKRIFPELIKSLISTPFIVEGEVCGSLSVFGENITEKDVPTIWHFSQIVSSAINLKKATLRMIEGIEERKRSEEEKENLRQQLIQAQKMDAVGTLAGGIAHDFNNMLAVILGNIQLALLDVAPGTSLAENLSEVEQAVGRAKNLTMKLLTFARKEKLSVNNVSVNVVLDEIVAVLKRTIPKKISVVTILGNDLQHVSGDVNQMQQVFLNVCNNACDAMPGGGTLTVETSMVDVDNTYAAQCVDVAPGRYCLIQISDTGVGMDEKVTKRIFEPFFTTKGVGKGTGLGLSVSYGIVKNHGGFINVYSAPGEGATFKIYLPFAETDGNEVALSNGNLTISTGTETVLVVDDERACLDLANKILTNAGYNVLTADSGTGAVKLFRKHGSEISLVVLDMIMPDMDGHDVYRQIKKVDPGVRVVLASGYSINGQAGKLMTEGIKGFIQKPFTLTELCEMVRSVIDDN